MRVSFACPSCDAKGSADSVHVGKPVRCKRCGADFTIPRPDAEDDDVYALEEPAEPPARWVPASSSNQEAVFVPARGDAGLRDRPGRARTEPAPTPRRKEEPGFPWQRWLLWGGIGLVVVLVLIMLLAPNGTTIAGGILLVLGSVMILMGYGAGAYGAFHEDLLYGLLYVTIPLYTAYYLVTRWEDLWVWLTCSTVGVGLILLGTELIRWAGAPI
jgi:hypothetical protein